MLRADQALLVPASRRGLLRRAGALTLSGAAVALLAGKGALAASADVQLAAMDNDVKILNSAIVGESQAIAAYQVGAESGLLQKAALDVAVKFQSDHKAHRDALMAAVKKLGFLPAEPPAKFDFPTDKLKTQADVLRFAAGLEKGAASAYLSAIPKFEHSELAQAAASILGAETMHWSILLAALGENPSPITFVS